MQSLAIAYSGDLLENTRITHEDSTRVLSRYPAVQKAYPGAGGRSSEPRAAAQAREEAAAAPTLAAVRPGPPRRREEQIGIPIDALVGNAVRVSSECGSKFWPRAADPSGDSRLASTLKEIKKAAANTRESPVTIWQ